jgi:hypothetical protein
MRKEVGRSGNIVYRLSFFGVCRMMLDVDKAIITDIYLSPPRDNYPARLYCSILTDDSNMRVSVVNGAEDKLRSVSLTPVSLQAKLIVRKIGQGQVLELHNPIIRIRGVAPAAPAPEKS